MSLLNVTEVRPLRLLEVHSAGCPITHFFHFSYHTYVSVFMQQRTCGELFTASGTEKKTFHASRTKIDSRNHKIFLHFHGIMQRKRAIYAITHTYGGPPTTTLCYIYYKY